MNDVVGYTMFLHQHPMVQPWGKVVVISADDRSYSYKAANSDNSDIDDNWHHDAFLMSLQRMDVTL